MKRIFKPFPDRPDDGLESGAGDVLPEHFAAGAGIVEPGTDVRSEMDDLRIVQATYVLGGNRVPIRIQEKDVLPSELRRNALFPDALPVEEQHARIQFGRGNPVVGHGAHQLVSEGLAVQAGDVARHDDVGIQADQFVVQGEGAGQRIKGNVKTFVAIAQEPFPVLGR